MELQVDLKVKKYKTEGDIAWEYNPLRNLKNENGEVCDFQVSNESLNMSLDNPVDIECQQSYDGSINLILNDDNSPPRIINNRFTLLENNRYKIINRNQIKQSNLYDEKNIDNETRLFRNVQKIPKLTLNKVSSFGQLQGGNYVFYMKYADDDYNQTDIVAETGIVSVFHGNPNDPKSCSGAFMDERTDKSIVLSLDNIDTSFTYFNLYFTRTSCDMSGVPITKAYKIRHNYEITDEYQLISINGFEELTEITIDELNIQYNVVTRVKSQAQVQNRLFFANVDKPEDKNAELRNLSLHIIVKEKQDDQSIGFIDPATFSTKDTDSIAQSEYYSPYNIYYKLGYFPGEIYRLGIVYIFNDDHLSPTYNLRGVDFNSVENEQDNLKWNYSYKGYIETIPYKDFLEGDGNLSNTAGVFRFTKSGIKDNKPVNQIIDYVGHQIKPLGIQIEFPKEVLDELAKFDIKGYFFVRQARIPIFLAQGFSIGVDGESFVPMLRDGNDSNGNKYITESFLNKSRTLVNDYESRIVNSNNKQSSGLVCVDAYVNRQLQSMFNTSSFNLVLSKTFNYKLERTKKRLYYPDTSSWYENEGETNVSCDLLYIDSEIPQKIHNDFGFSTKAGMQEELKQIINFGKHVIDDKDNTNYIRGIYGSFIGTTNNLTDNCIYSIYSKNYSEVFLKEYFTIRLRDKSPFFAITDRYGLKEFSSNEKYIATESKDNITKKPDRINFSSEYSYIQELRKYLKLMKDCGENVDKYLNMSDNKLAQSESEIADEFTPKDITYNTSKLPLVFRGDCFTETVCHRIQRNFTSASVPINDDIIEPNCWKENFKGALSTEDWDNISKADVDAVPIGSWIIYKCLSNYNIGLRSNDTFNVDEMAIMGNPRGFYPINDISVKSSNKIPETSLYNMGYNATLGVRKNFAFERVPYIKDVFDTRIMFSNTQVDGEFKNSYKVFQGLAYEDMDRQYGGITKILPWSNNLLCVFEHAIAIVPVNEKALIQTTTGQNIHMYGTGVLQKQLSIITDMYGSSWKDSIVRTNQALYGVDTSAKKIWKVSKDGFVLISDFTVQRFLNDNINLKELDKDVVLGVRNVKTHYNAYKNDIMFTFYNRDKIWNLCYNEIRQNWVTRYSWTPLLSENINNSYFSFDLLKTKIFGIINSNLQKRDGELLTDSSWDGVWYNHKSEDKELSLFINKDYSGFNICSLKVIGHSFNPKTSRIVDTELCSVTCDENYSINQVDNDYIKADIYNVINQSKDDNFSSQNKTYEYYVNNNLKNKRSIIKFKASGRNENKDINKSDYLYYSVEISYLPYLIASYGGDLIDNEVYETSDSLENNALVFAAYERTFNVGMIIPYDSNLPKVDEDNWNKALLHNIYGHGRSINADEINYFNYIGPNSKQDQILPTKWYDRQEPFEFEIVVNEPRGIHKIFDNLVIMSNNAEPDSLEIEIVGDVYNFNKRKNYLKHNFDKKEWEGLEPEDPPMDKDRYMDVEFDKINILGYTDETGENVFTDNNIDRLRGTDIKPITYNTRVEWDPILDEYTLVVHQDLADIKKYGRRIGNIHYTEDSWKITLQPIYYTHTDLHNGINSQKKSTRIRDKWAKIRIKYSGKRLAVLTAIQIAMTQSYA